MKNLNKIIIIISISLIILLGCEKKDREITHKTDAPTVTDNKLENKAPRKETVTKKQENIDDQTAE